ncbi:YjzC family protein [Candidatus Dependentiae bacterium]|nr:YjzC family protein [Candidatus Dependentiae bacterium]
MANIGDKFNIGEICPESGVYKLREHDCGKGHAQRSEEQREIPLTKGEKFPPCKNCQAGVTWVLVKKA